MTMKQRRQQGFTLIEIIAVIILLGVLAATIVPKITNLTTEAKAAASKQAVAEGIARANGYIAKAVLKAEGTVAWADVIATSGGNLSATSETSGDYTITYASGTGGVNIVAWNTAEGSSAGTESGLAAYPE